ncbi:SDR family oxidoreductase [Chromobacterium subtsugae]|mgnify:CR=1 FL=1|uniref:SDR family oxidoreductase n=1 Tax=Chromobacterium subtsugae TaxID=251747 RepID=A0ABS7FIG1_9NEIS|nr:SDR family oxidoreductase [Chromobacterium subtsugae]KZE85039.1 short-chain dehydrogenase [Chromobacterium sp. F49]KUM03285.1 short-chain dehydrogenase [Chromobacterium subtsugae]MBW7568511.1 SDR family oxidoreductase [Chromobacterium subtsugae]MBW8289863.1 SDR family oxidoreductase [Chromobacterium subtsugae]WSE89571.1 SDR family oxidoreductase [Chromobacterium subtsugae]
MSQSHFAGKVALVVGASRNMGRAFAEALAADGAAVAIHYNSAGSRAGAEEAAAQIHAAGGQAFAVQADITKTAEVRRLFDAVEARFGHLDILINTAGMMVKKPVTEVSEEEFDAIFALNTKAAFFCLQEAGRRLRDNGRILSIGTSLLAATTGYYGVYAGSKAPLEDFTRALAKEVGQRGITVNVVAPGPMDTEFFYAVETPETVAYLKLASINGELGQVADLVPLVKHLVSPENRWTTAQTLFINGGFVSR